MTRNILSYEDWLASKQTHRGSYRHYTEAQYREWAAGEEQAIEQERQAEVRAERDPLLELTDLDIRLDYVRDEVSRGISTIPGVMDSLAAELRAAQQAALAQQSAELTAALGQVKGSRVLETRFEREPGPYGRVTGTTKVMADGSIQRTTIVRDDDGRPVAAMDES